MFQRSKRKASEEEAVMAAESETAAARNGTLEAASDPLNSESLTAESGKLNLAAERELIRSRIGHLKPATDAYAVEFVDQVLE